MAIRADVEATDVAVTARMDGIDARRDGLATEEHVLRTLMLALLPIHLGMLGMLGILASLVGRYPTG